MNLSISKKSIVKSLSIVVIVLILLSITGQLYKYLINDGENRYIFDFLNLDKEHNLPTLYSTLSLYFCGILLMIISFGVRFNKEKFFLHWCFLGLTFLYLGTDEILVLHEQIISPLRSVINTTGFLYITWVIPALILVLFFALAYIKFLKALPAKTRNWFIVSGIVFVLGAVGLEVIGSNYMYNYGQDSLSYSFITTVEETLEMTGILMFINTLLDYLSTYYYELNIVFRIPDEDDN